MTRGIFVLSAAGGIILVFVLAAGRGIVSDIRMGIFVGMIGCVLVSMVGYKLCDVQEKLDAVYELLTKQSERDVAESHETNAEPMDETS